MAYNVTDILGSINKYGVLPTNKFVVSFSTPKTLQNVSVNGQNVSDMGRLVQARAEQCRLPGVTYMVSDVNRYGVGPMQKMPYNVQFTDTSISFIADRKSELYTLFYAWLNSIFDFSGDGNSKGQYNTEYKFNYSSDITIQVYDNYGPEPIQTFVLSYAYPISINEIPLNWNQNNELMKIVVGFTFRDWRLEDSTTSAPPTPPPTSASTPPQVNLPSYNQGANSPNNQ